MTVTVTLRGRSFTFEFHSERMNGPSHLAVNVKQRAWPKLPVKYANKMRRLAEVRGTANYEDKIEQQAYESVQEWWWDWARDHVKEHDGSDIYSAGRSGGWLVFHDYTERDILEIVEEYDPQCELCDKPFWFFHEETSGKCLFQATEHQTMPVTEHLKTLLTLEKLTIDICDSLAYIDKDLLREWKYIIDEEWTMWREEVKRERADKALRAADKRRAKGVTRGTEVKGAAGHRRADEAQGDQPSNVAV